eukprot:superscaffoldBa00000248_g3137
MLGISQHFTLTTAAAAVLLACVLSFNVDQKNGLSFNGPLEDMFGYTVQQFENSEGKWVLIGSPLSGQPAKRTGDVYKCPVGKGDNTCIKLELPQNTTVPKLREVKENMTMGTTLVTNPNGGFLACGPQYGYMCGEQQYISGVCANVSSSFQILNSIAPSVQECGKELDIVIVLDGSNSIYPWSSIIDFLDRFIHNIQIGPKLSQVGIVSYGETVTHRVNLSQFDNKAALLEFVKDLPQQTGFKTMTFLGIDTARKEAYMPERGARPGAKKVMVIVTDGESHDSHNNVSVIKACENDDIERFGIAEGVLLGAVGAYEWNGTVVMHTAGGEVIPGKSDFYDPESEAGYEALAGYLGYDVQSASSPNGVLYITGAPRYNHTGRVVIYHLDKNNKVVVSQILKGEQIGSYFGSVLQTLDVDGDSYTDLLLVGAPMYMGSERNEQGQVYVYKLDKDGQFQHEFTLKPINQSCCTAHSDSCTNKNEPCGARFGTAIAAISDLNLDGYNDVAVGAPFENDHRGAVYIYHGDKTSLKEKYVQRIPAGGDGEKVKFFGQSIHGVMDLNGDGITDVTIGGLGGASLFWSRDVAQLRANMTFDPVKINLQQSQYQCERGGRKSVCVSTTLCFTYSIKSDKQDLDSVTEIRYDLILDALRAKARALFYDSDNKSDRKITNSFKIRDRDTKCLSETFMMSARLDFRDPLMVSLQFRLADEDKGPVLDESLPKSINKTIPLVDCGSDEKCIADLSLEAVPSVKQMVIKKNKDKIDVTIRVKNSKDNAYNTKVILSFTPNINYVKAEPEMDCTLNHTKVECAVGYPFLASNVEENFKVKFELNPKHIQREIQINVTATSDSEELTSTLHDNSVQITIPVKYEPELIFSAKTNNMDHIVVKEGEKYSSIFNDTSMIGENITITYKVKSDDSVTPPLDLKVTYPQHSPLKNDLLYLTHITTSPKVKCDATHLINPYKLNPETMKPNPKKESLSVYLLNCKTSDCASFTCSIPEANINEVNVTFRVWKPTFIKVKIHVSKETLGGIPIWIIIISILIGLLILALVIFALWKLGFFKRKSRDYSKEEIMD